MLSRLLLVGALLSVAAPGATAEPQPAYRVGSASSRVAILPVRCERDLDPALCSALGESIAIEVSREPRLRA